jgi:hypothetical protein
MTAIKTTIDLKLAIEVLQKQRSVEAEILKVHVLLTLENAKPSNMIASSLSHLVHSKTVKENVLDMSLGMGAGFVAKKMIVGSSTAFLPSVLGSMVQFFVSRKVLSSVKKMRED